MTKRRTVVSLLVKNGFQPAGGTKHEKFVKGSLTVEVGRHRDLSDQTVMKILREAKLR